VRVFLDGTLGEAYFMGGRVAMTFPIQPATSIGFATTAAPVSKRRIARPSGAAPRRCLLAMSPGAAGPPRLRLCGARAVMPQRFVFRVRSARGFC
jgi:hypothetical protein